MPGRGNARFRLSSWTARYFTRSSASCSRTSASRRSRRRCRRAPASPSRRCRSCSRRSTSSSDGRLVCLLPEDADARDAAEAAGWFLGDDAVALLPSRGVALGLRPRAAAAPRRRAGAGARRARRAAASSAPRRRRSPRALPPPPARPAPIRARASATSRASTALAEALALAGYERVERAEERGQFAVRGGLVDVFPTTGREPLRIEFFGDEIEQVRAFSPFTQRALHAVDDAVVYPAAERRPTSASRRSPTTRTERRRRSRRPRAAARPRAGLSSGSPTRCGEVWARGGLGRARRSRGASELDPLPAGPAVLVRGAAAGDRGARAGRGRERARRLRARRQPRRRRVPAPRRGAAHAATCSAASRRELLEPARPLPREPELRVRRRARAARLRLARARARRSCPTRRSSASARRAPTARLGRALQSFADLRTGDYVVHEDHGVGKLLGFETKEVAGVTRDYLLLAFRGDDRLYVPHEQIGKVSRYIGADAKRARALEARRQGVAEPEEPRARERVRELAGELLALYAQRQQAPGVALRPRARVARAARGGVPLPRDRGPGARDRGGQGGPRGAAADGPARLRRRRLRQDRGRRPRRLRRRRQRQAGADARARRRSSPSSTGTRSAIATATSRCASRWSRASASRPRRSRCSPTSPTGKVDVLIGTHRVLSPRRHPEGPRARDPRRGAALRRRAEGAAALAAARGRRARALRDADPAHAAHVALRPARHLDHRDAAGGPAADPHDGRRVRRGARPDGARARASSAAGRRSTCTTASRRSRRRPRSCSSLPEAPLPRRARPDEGARARGEDARVPARRRRRARLDDDHRVGPRHPAGEHADRRARGHARPRPALPDPRPRRPLGRDRARVPLLSRTRGADARRRGRGWRRSPTTPSSAPASDRDARPRDPRRRRPARRRAVRPRRGARLRALRRDARRGGRGAPGPAAARRRGRSASTRGSTRTYRRATSPRRR